jgi:hypothetical protein
MNEWEQSIIATRLVNARFRFLIHLAAFALVNVLLVGVNLLFTPGVLWFQWSLLGWGLGVVLHAAIVYRIKTGERLQRRIIERALAKKERADKREKRQTERQERQAKRKELQPS